MGLVINEPTMMDGTPVRLFKPETNEEPLVAPTLNFEEDKSPSKDISNPAALAINGEEPLVSPELFD